MSGETHLHIRLVQLSRACMLWPSCHCCLQKLVEEGKVKYLGISEATPEEIKRCARLLK